MRKRFFIWLLVLVGAFFLGRSFFHSTPSTPPPSQAASAVTTASSSTASQSATDQGLEFTSNPTEPITFLTGSLPVTISQKEVASAAADGQYLVSNAKSCGPKDRPRSYFSDNAKILAKLPKTVYTITSADKKTHYHVTLIPNLLGYKDLFLVQADFFSCKEDAGHLRALAMNENSLAFGEVCAQTDTECQRMAAVIDSSVRIK